MTVSRLRPYAITVFAEMSALAARVGAVNLGQGFPDEDGPAAMLKTGRERDRRWRQPVPARPRHRAAARSDRRAAPAPLRYRVRRRHRGARHGRCDGSHRRRRHRAGGAGLRGADDRAVLRLLLPCRRNGRLPSGDGAAGERRTRLCGRRRRYARSDHATHPGSDRQLAAQPHRHGRHRRRTQRDRGARGGPRPAGDHR